MPASSSCRRRRTPPTRSAELYRKSAQALTLDADIPEMPTDFHELIVWEALKRLGNFDEGQVQQRAEWANNARLVKFDLERDQLPPITICGALA